MGLLRRKVRPRTKPEPDRVRSASYLQWLRGCVCGIHGYRENPSREKHVCEGRIEAAHVRTGTDGAMGIKPSDCYALPLCEKAHRLQHQIGEAAFERMFGVSLRNIASTHFEAWTRNTAAGQSLALKQRERA